LNKKSDEEVLDKYMDMAKQAGPNVSLITLTMDKNGVPQDMDSITMFGKLSSVEESMKQSHAE